MTDITDIAALKRKERIAARERTSCKTLEEMVAGSRAEVDALLDILPPFKRVLLYWPLRDEPDIKPLFQHIWNMGGETLLPRCRADGGLDAVIYNAGSSLETGALSVTYPSKGEVIPPTDIDAAVIPALAYDRTGVRLGRGGGYYDRFLPTLRDNAETFGVCFSWNVLAGLPREAHDIAVKHVIYS